jgi:hypothetical protein
MEQIKTMKVKFGFLLMLVICTSGCSALLPSNTDYQVVQEYSLPTDIVETSGLYCPEENTGYTVNDSGNQPVIYRINETGQLLEQQSIGVPNFDWEAITGNDTHFFVGDIGNNRGKRESIFVYAISKQQSKGQSAALELSYLANNLHENRDRQHDFDAESLVAVDNTLYLFSKSWKTNLLFVYEINQPFEFEAKQSIKPVTQITELPGVITGGDFDTVNQRFVLVGYKVQSLGWFQPFITLLGRDFSVQKTIELTGFGQVEALCVNPNGEVWITQEGSLYSSQKLARLIIH